LDDEEEYEVTANIRKLYENCAAFAVLCPNLAIEFIIK
jgi:hypothetical protein